MEIIGFGVSRSQLATNHLSAARSLTHYPQSPTGWGKELKKQKWEKNVGQDKDCLTNEGRKSYKNLNRQRQSLTASHKKTNT